ncbi:hypothetical protein Bhyg_09762 [Pseudolycoriella hygida]|uniref:Uncharacterized protein n=1 Tax=Pseudolycoriella hygida TaxID=35572 RepID=A0A9Q0RYD6_9DIPT|nr:hypothetical protein Bhyg_09762 [Pseudolycoriella hygida]
MAPEKYILT